MVSPVAGAAWLQGRPFPLARAHLLPQHGVAQVLTNLVPVWRSLEQFHQRWKKLGLPGQQVYSLPGKLKLQGQALVVEVSMVRVERDLPFG